MQEIASEPTQTVMITPRTAITIDSIDDNSSKFFKHTRTVIEFIGFIVPQSSAVASTTPVNSMETDDDNVTVIVVASVLGSVFVW